jgi:hypothetical protein
MRSTRCHAMTPNLPQVVTELERFWQRRKRLMDGTSRVCLRSPGGRFDQIRSAQAPCCKWPTGGIAFLAAAKLPNQELGSMHRPVFGQKTNRIAEGTSTLRARSSLQTHWHPRAVSTRPSRNDRGAERCGKEEADGKEGNRPPFPTIAQTNQSKHLRY